MTKLWILLFVSLFIAQIIVCRDRINIHRSPKQREQLFTLLLIIILGFFCGLRTWGNDTVTYVEIYNHLTPTLDNLRWEDLMVFSEGIALKFFFCLFKTLGFTSQDMLLSFGFATIILYVSFVRKHSTSFVFSMFLMFATGFYTFSMAAIKQTIATGFCLLAITASIEKKWGRFFILVFIASLFHPYSIIYFILPFLFYKPWSTSSYLYILIFLFAGIFLDSLIGSVLSVTDMFGADYSVEEMMGEGVNIFRVLVSFVPVVLSFIYRRQFFSTYDRRFYLMVNISMVHALIMFVGIFGTANYFARLANYFLPSVVIVLPWMLQKLSINDKKFFYPTSIIGYTGYFIYENAIIRPFDSGYSHLSIFKYLSDLLSRI